MECGRSPTPDGGGFARLTESLLECPESVGYAFPHSATTPSKVGVALRKSAASKIVTRSCRACNERSAIGVAPID